MVGYIQVVVFAAIVALSNAAPTSLKHVLHEKRQRPSSDWIKGARIEGSAILPMRIGLTQTNLENGHDFLMDVSHPSSPNYGRHWSAEEVHEMFAPTEHAVLAVKEWLGSFGIDESRVVHSENRGWIAFDASVDEAEELLLAEFHEHEHQYSEKVRVGCDRYHVPAHLQQHIDYITPGIKLTPVVKRSIKTKRSFSPKRKSINRWPSSKPPPGGFPWGYKPPGAELLPIDLRACGQNFTPVCMKALYKIPPATLKSPGNSLGLYEQGDYFAESDLNSFFAMYAPWVPQGTFPIPALIDGANYSFPASNTEFVGGEADIDIDISTSLIYPQTVTLYQVDDQIYEPEEIATTNLFNTFLDALDGSYCNYTAYGETGDDPSIDAVYPDSAPGGYKGKLQCGTQKPTNVISASYIQSEADLPANYTKRQCNEFMKLGLQGHTVVVCSGDYGVASFADDGDANGCLGPEATIFNPQYPNGCPYVTSVGATMLYNDQTILDPESVMAVDLGGTAVNFSSAGGFSNYFEMPSYQKTAVEQYLKTANLEYPYYSEFEPDFDTVQGLYNRIGRGYPDLASNGAYYPTYVNGEDSHWFGTSLAAPTVASILTLINEERFAIGKGPVGFINPSLYANPGILTDITNGTNLGCGSEGFHAQRGWDPATGLGTPNFPKMLEFFLALP